MSKYYKLKKSNPDENFRFILVSKIEKIEDILYNSYESDCGIGKENYNYIMKFINSQQKEITKLSEKVANSICANVENEVLEEYRQKIEKQQKEIKDLEDENNFLKEMYRDTTEYKAIETFIKEN